MKTLEEKLDKERLLNIAASDFNGSFELVNVAIDVDNPNKETTRRVLDNENVLKSFIDLERTLELTAKFSEDGPPLAVRARVWYAIILILHNRKVPDALDQKIAENKVETMNYYNFLKSKNLEIPHVIYDAYKNFKSNINESSDKQIISEKLNKDKLKAIILNSPNTAYKYVEKYFLKNNQKPPEEFINAILKDAHASYKYMNWAREKNVSVPKNITQSILKSPDLSFNIVMRAYDGFDDPEVRKRGWDLYKLFSEKDLENSIAKDSSRSHELYNFYKKLDKKIPEVIWNSIAQNSKTSRYVAESLLEKGEEIPLKLFNAIAKDLEDTFVISKNLIRYNKDLPDILLKVIAENPQETRVLGDLNKILLQYVDHGKKIPQILLDAAAKRTYIDPNLYQLCYDLALRRLKIPDEILDIFIQKTPEYGPNNLSEKSYKIITHYLNTGGDKKEKFESLPTRLYQYVITPPYYIKGLSEKFLKNFGKIPEEFKKAILDHYDQYYERKYIPKDVADAIGIKINESKIISEKLDRERLMYMAIKETPVAIDLLTQLAYSGKDIPDLLSLVVAERSSASICARIASYIIAYSDKEVPESFLEKIATNKKIAKDIAYIYANNRKRIPEMIKKLLSKKDREFYDNFKGGEFFAIHTMPINEALDKNRLLSAVEDGFPDEGFNHILRYYFYKNNELPPDEVIDLAAKGIIRSTIFAEYCLEKKKEIRPDIIEKIAEDPRNAYAIAALMTIEKRDVPDILIDSIKKDPTSLKHYKKFLSGPHIPLGTKVYLKI